ncbi:magnesium chelatase subunit ChlD-like protein [Rhodoferax sp. OV413]|uniref:vWA domain-containing protein n=1 Tax=Rhodoferax sp. OV413 TaxID=1855285 RepID=UPI000886E23A|nr:VWA domain-containing protein [Rhodoferax sp. OV413]SDP53198.1 magnesium chelatase subunit ChlD-like protein [Rhodoferax sp. OV413]
MQALGDGAAIAWLRTLLVKGPQALQRDHLRYQPHVAAVPRLHLILLDTSGSMRQGGQGGRLALAKGHAAHLIEQAARAGDHVGLLCFGGSGVELVVPPGPARAAGAARVRQCGGGGGTPLRQALNMANTLLVQAKRRSGGPAWLWLLTDGRTLEQPAAPRGTEHAVVMDFDDRSPAIGRCAAWAEHWGAEYRLASASI